MSEQSSTLFVYGSLKPGELGFEQIEAMVSKYSAAELHDFALYVRDGLPIIRKPAPGETVDGVLLTINAEMEEDFWQVVTEYEGTTNYKFENSIPVISVGKEHLSGAFIGRKMGSNGVATRILIWIRNSIIERLLGLLHAQLF